MKRTLLFLIITACLMAAFCLTASAMEGSGTETDPYIIETAEDLATLNNKTAYYKLNEDITAASTTGAIVENFSGYFDGNGHTITLDINAPLVGSTHTFDALFGVVSGGEIKNLKIAGTVTGTDKVSGIVGKLAGGNVNNCVNYATVSGKKNIGGIVGLITGSGTVSNCVNFGSINGITALSKGLDMGGIVGCIWDISDSNAIIVSNCFNAGTITANGYNAGGVIGHIKGGKYKNLFNVGSVSVNNNLEHVGEIIAEISKDWNGTYYVDGYFAKSDMLVGYRNDRPFVATNPMIESTGVSIYLGKGSGIRGEFHVNESVLASLVSLIDSLGYEIEYGTVVSTKDAVIALNGDLLSCKDDSVIFAPAIKNGEKQYFFTDESKGADYHSYRFALTGFDETKELYNMEFVILGYVMVTDGEGNEQIFPINTVKSERLASMVGETGFNAVSIVRVAEATIEDGDFEGNDEALDKLDEIVSNKDYSSKIEIDGLVGYGYKNATFTKSISSEDTVVFNITSTDNEELITYTDNLVKAGYQKVFENTIEGLDFYTYKKDTSLIHITYDEAVNEVIISYETVTNLPSFTKPTYNKVANPSVTQLTQKTQNVKEGMSYVIQLSDGTFFIVDGGWCDDNGKEADRLYNKLVALAGEGNDIVISGWIFTHCHGDHIGTFNFFVDKYHDSVTIKEILYNFPADADISASGSSYMLDSSKQRYGEFRRVIKEYLTDTKFVKLHSGYKFYYADLEVEILQTLEDLYPQTVANYDFNSSSTIFTVEIAGQKMLFLGDISSVGATRLNSVYSSALKSDFVQIAHHGLNYDQSIKNIYISADSQYVFFPTCEEWYNQHSGSGANFYLLTESKTVKQVFVSYKATMTLALPYDGSQYDGEKFPGFSEVIPDDSDRVEVSRPQGTVTLPNAYFDLDLSGNAPTDKAGNATVTANGGGIYKTTVYHNGTKAVTNAFTGDRSKGNYYMTVNFNDITTDAQMGDFIMSSSTFEIFLKLESLPRNTVGLFTSCNAGGYTIYLRKEAGQINFQIGSTKPNANSDAGSGKGNYSAAVPMNNLSLNVAEAGELLHIVTVYDSESNMMKLYINGILAASENFGEGGFNDGEENDFVFGIGYNPQYNENNIEAISRYANYEVYEAKIYNSALTATQVAKEYWNCIDNIFEVEGN